MLQLLTKNRHSDMPFVISNKEIEIVITHSVVHYYDVTTSIYHARQSVDAEFFE